MIIGFEGGLGSGKTIGMVRYLIKDYIVGNKIYANFHLKKIDYELLDVMSIMENPNLGDCSIGIDEITVFLDCRRSGSKSNRLLSYFILQTRKRDVILYYTTQDFGMVDLRLFNHTDIQIICTKVKDENGADIPNMRMYSVLDRRDISNIDPKNPFKRFYLDISKYYDFYDTKEVILPPV